MPLRTSSPGSLAQLVRWREKLDVSNYHGKVEKALIEILDFIFALSRENFSVLILTPSMFMSHEVKSNFLFCYQSNNILVH